MMKKLKVILIGGGDRGMRYTNIMKDSPDKYEVIAVAEPIENRREFVREKHSIPEDMCFLDWRPLLEKGKIADLCVIATMDRDHFAPAMKAIELGYDLLLEKPMAPTQEECTRLAALAEEKGVKVVICTVLRYSDVFRTLKRIIDDGKVGRIMSINHEECVGLIHQSHSFVRGNWGNIGRSSNMLLQKSCHDIDILQWLIGKKCKKVQSFGALSYFTEKNAPEGAPEFCYQGCPAGETCPFNAVKLYYDDKENGWFRGAATKHVYHTDEMVWDAITKTQYGKCVYHCDNDVVDHQTVNMLFEDDVTATFTMNAFNAGGRHIHIMGTEGEIRAALDSGSPISVYYHRTKTFEEFDITGTDGVVGGHGGGDEGIVETLYHYLTGSYNGTSIPEISESYYNHSIVFAAEKAREENTVVDFEEYFEEINR
ncbi:MAG: Gfo/Idh/MocA family oxidoreductase [Clostridia bacterium]|nr:Gfo/Idh/MocA family oxidoreductase [Clostridia bacterium]